jgi:hypothetical protein
MLTGADHLNLCIKDAVRGALPLWGVSKCFLEDTLDF